MASKILVAFLSRYGATAEVARAVADELIGCGLDVEVKPLREVRDLAPYGGIVLGAPLYFGALPKEAVEFLARQEASLRNVPVAFFALGPLHPDGQEQHDAQAALDGQLAKLTGLNPVARTVFGGKFDPATLSLGHRLVAALSASPLHGLPATDARDWQAIRAWAVGLVPAFRHARQTEVPQ